MSTAWVQDRDLEKEFEHMRNEFGQMADPLGMKLRLV
jgi:hypothetical protein